MRGWVLRDSPLIGLALKAPLMPHTYNPKQRLRGSAWLGGWQVVAMLRAQTAARAPAKAWPRHTSHNDVLMHMAAGAPSIRNVALPRPYRLLAPSERACVSACVRANAASCDLAGWRSRLGTPLPLCKQHVLLQRRVNTATLCE